MAAGAAVLGLLLSSTASALLMKVLFQLEGPGIDQHVHNFVKPWFTTWESALACWASLLFLALQRAWAGRAQQHKLKSPAEQPLLGQAAGKEDHSVTWTDLGRLVLPAITSVASMILQGVGLRYISASTSFVLGGSAILFTAALSVILLHSRLNALHCSGILLVLAGTAVVAVANVVWPMPELRPGLQAAHGTSWFQMGHDLWQRSWVQAPPGTASATALGVGLTLLSMFLLAARLVSEEALLTKSTLHPLQVLGYEGLIGAIAVAAVGVPLTMLLPGSDAGGRLENWQDSFVMLWRSPRLSIINGVYFASVVGLNIWGVQVTCMLGSLFRAVLLTTRTALVWGAGVGLWKLQVAGGTIGEAWVSPTSEYQLLGFALLLLGTIIYAQGSSHVAADYHAAKQADGEAVHAPLSRRLQHIPSITQLRPYTSLYIPPRRMAPEPSTAPVPSSLPITGADKQRGGSRTLLHRLSAPARSSCLPPVCPPLTSPPAGDAHAYRRSETTPLLHIPVPQGEAPLAPSFLSTLTSHSSWIVPKHRRLNSRQHTPVGTSPTDQNGHGYEPPAVRNEDASATSFEIIINGRAFGRPSTEEGGAAAEQARISASADRPEGPGSEPTTGFAATAQQQPHSATSAGRPPPFPAVLSRSGGLSRALASSPSHPEAQLASPASLPAALADAAASLPADVTSQAAHRSLPEDSELETPFATAQQQQQQQQQQLLSGRQDIVPATPPPTRRHSFVDSRHGSADSSTLLGHSPTPAKLSEILSASRKHFQAMPAFAEDDSSSSGSEDEQQPASSSPPHAHTSAHLETHSNQSQRRSSAPEALPSASASSPPVNIVRAGSHASSRSTGSRPDSPAAAPLTIRTGARSRSSSPPGSASTVRPGFATLGQSPTPEVLAERRTSRRHTDHLPSTAEEQDPEADESAAHSASRAASAPGSVPQESLAGDDEAAATIVRSAPEPDEPAAVAPVAARQPEGNLPFPDLFSEDLELDVTPTAQDRPALSPSPSAAASLAASGPSTSSTPRRSSAGVGLAALLGGSPFPMFTGGRSGTATPGTPLSATPGQRIITQAELGRSQKAGLAGLLDESASTGRPAGGRPPSMSAVARRLQDATQQFGSSESGEQRSMQ